MKISFAFEFNSTNSSSAGTNLGTFRFYQKFYRYLARYLATWQSKEGLKETEKENIWIAAEKMRVRKKNELCRQKVDVTEELKIVGLLL